MQALLAPTGRRSRPTARPLPGRRAVSSEIAAASSPTLAVEPPARRRPGLDVLMIRPRQPRPRALELDEADLLMSDGALDVRSLDRQRERKLASTSTSVREEPTPPSPDRSPVVLVAEDHDALRELTTTFLRREGFRVISAADGQAALEAVTSEPIDLLVSDVHMPRMGGLELAERLLTAQPRVAILLTSGADPPVTRHAFLPKPFSSNQLLASLRRLRDDSRSSA